MDYPSENMDSDDHLQTVSRRTFLEVTAGLFAAYSGNALGKHADEGSIAPLNPTL